MTSVLREMARIMDLPPFFPAPLATNQARGAGLQTAFPMLAKEYLQSEKSCPITLCPAWLPRRSAETANVPILVASQDLTACPVTSPWTR